MKNIYIIRHGETAFNFEGKVQGRGIDAPLNETGQKQADLFFQKYQHLPIEEIYISSLKRTKQTVANFIEKKIPVIETPDLDEISWGKYEGMRFSQDFSDEYAALLTAWQSGKLNHRAQGGESPLEVWSRLALVVQKWLDSPYNNILVCMHGRAMRMMISLICGTPLAKMDQYPHQNTGLYHVEMASLPAKIILCNDGSHLVRQ